MRERCDRTACVRFAARWMMRLAMIMAILAAMAELAVAAHEVPASSKTQRETVVGTVASVELLKRIVVVEPRGVFVPKPKKTLIVNAETDIVSLKGDRRLRLNDVRPGAQVKVDYTVQGGKNMAQTVIVQQPLR